MKSAYLALPEIRIDNSLMSDSRAVLIQGDTLSFLKTVPDRMIKLVITSPPYNIGKKYETKVSLDKYLKEYIPLISELVRVLSDDGSICWQVGNYVHSGEIFPLDICFYPVFKNFGLFLRNRIVWRFGHGLHCKKRFSGRYETILWFTKSDLYTYNLDAVRVPAKYPGKKHFKGAKKGQLSCNPLGKNPSDIWDFLCNEWDSCVWDIPNVKSNHPEKTIHPCQFPVELVERCVLALTEEEDWVLDPFAGVFSAGIGALKNKRRAMGIEREFEFTKVSRQRIEDLFKGTLKTRPLGKEIYKP